MSDKPQLSWAGFLHRWLESEPSALRNLTITPKRAPLSDWYEGCDIREEKRSIEETKRIIDEAQAAERTGSRGARARIFSYAFRKAHFSQLVVQPEDNLKHFLLGKDHRFYYYMMERIAYNTGREITLSPSSYRAVSRSPSFEDFSA